MNDDIFLADAIPGSAQVAVPPAAERKQARDPHKWQQAVVTVGRQAVMPADLGTLIADAAALVAETLDAEHNGAAELSVDGQSLCHRVALGKTDAGEPRTVIQQTGAGAADSLAGYVLKAGRPVIVADLAHETRIADAFLAKQGVRSAIAAPLELAGRTFGALAAYSGQPQRFDPQDALFVEVIANLVSTTIARRRTEEALDRQQRLSTGVFATLDAMVLVLDPHWEINYINPACERLTGVGLATLKHRSVTDLFATAEEAQAFGQLLAQLRQGRPSVECEASLPTKRLGTRRVAWNCSALNGADGAMESIIVTGIDVTDRYEAQRKAEEARQAAEAARRAVTVEAETAVAQTAVAKTEEEPLTAFGRLPVPLNAERRKRPRRSYPYTQRIASIIDGKLPARDKFIEVQCNDIAAGGFSYFCNTPPASDLMVVALGAAPALAYLTAQVAHVNRVQHNGKKEFLIGCNYVGRASY